MKSPRKYDRQFKLDAVALLQNSDKSAAQVARDLGIHPKRLYKWRADFAQHEDKAFPGKGNPHDQELARLQKENAELRMERDILKKALAIFSKTGNRDSNS